MSKRAANIITTAILFLVLGVALSEGQKHFAAITPPHATVTTATTTSVSSQRLGSADLYFAQPHCVGDGRISSLDVNISDPPIPYAAPDGVTYLPDSASATDTIAASVLRDEGCHNYAEPFDMTTYTARPTQE